MTPHQAKRRNLTALLGALFLSGCASPLVSLNEPSRSFMAPDLANLLKPRDIPYETKDIDDIEVGYNLMYSKSENWQGYRLTLVFRNKGNVPKLIQPVVALEDSFKLQIPGYSYEAFVAHGAALSGTPIPVIPASQQSSYYSSGTIRNTSTGSSYAYTGTTTAAPSGAASGFAAGVAQGMAIGAAAKASNDREEGLLMMKWANTYWLRNSYSLESGSGAVGALFFPSPKVGNLPINIKVTLSGKSVNFMTSEKLTR